MSNKNKNSYSKTNNNNLRFKVDDIKNNINNKLNFDIDEDKPLNTEIEKLDQEIFNLIMLNIWLDYSMNVLL